MVVGNEFLGDKLYCALDNLLRIIYPYPETIIIGSQLLDALASYMRSNLAAGLTVDAKGEYRKLYGIALQVDHALPCRLEFVYRSENCTVK